MASFTRMTKMMAFGPLPPGKEVVRSHDLDIKAGDFPVAIESLCKIGDAYHHGNGVVTVWIDNECVHVKNEIGTTIDVTHVFYMGRMEELEQWRQKQLELDGE